METVAQFPYIPEDVERLIIECAAENNRQTAHQLVHVCRQFQRWIDPIVYSAVTLRTSEKAESFLRTVKTSKCPLFFSTHVKALAFSEEIYLEQVVEVTSACTGIVSLAYWTKWSVGDMPPSVDISFAMSLRRLSFDIRHLVGKDHPDFGLPVLQNVTHLDIVTLNSDWSRWSWEGFTSLVHLSHLFIEVSDPDGLMGTIAPLLPCFPRNLRVCIVFVDSGMEEGIVFQPLEQLALGKVDSRIVLGTQVFGENIAYANFLVVRNFDPIFEDWGYPSGRKADIWEQAEGIIQNRRRLSPSSMLICSEPESGDD